MPRRSREDAEKTLESLLDAAAWLFIQQGVVKTTLAQIAQQAGVTRGALYWHFEGKDEIIQQLWDSSARPLLRQAMEDMAALDGQDVDQGLRHIISRLLQQLESNPRALQATRVVMHSVEVTEEGSDLQTWLFEIRDSFHAVAATVFDKMKAAGKLRTSLATDDVTEVFMTFMHSMLERNASISRMFPIKASADTHIDIFLAGVLKEQTA